MSKTPTKPTAKKALLPRSAKAVGSVPGAKAHTGARGAPRAGKQANSASKPAVAPKRPTRGAQTIALLKRSKGVSIDEIVAAFDVQKHTARALVSVFGRQAGGVERREGRYYLKG